MSASTTSVRAATSPYATPAFWDRLWRTSGIQFVVLFIIASLIYGYQPQVGAPAEALSAFYGGDRTRILIAAFFSGLARPRRCGCRPPLWPRHRRRRPDSTVRAEDARHLTFPYGY